MQLYNKVFVCPFPCYRHLPADWPRFALKMSCNNFSSCSGSISNWPNDDSSGHTSLSRQRNTHVKKSFFSKTKAVRFNYSPNPNIPLCKIVTNLAERINKMACSYCSSRSSLWIRSRQSPLKLWFVIVTIRIYDLFYADNRCAKNADLSGRYAHHHQHLLLVVYGNIRSGIERNWSNLALGQFDALRRGQHRRYLGHQLLPLLILDDATKKAVGDIAESMRGRERKQFITAYYYSNKFRSSTNCVPNSFLSRSRSKHRYHHYFYYWLVPLPRCELVVGGLKGSKN